MADAQISCDRVVIRDRHTTDTLAGGTIKQITRAQGAIRSGTMCVEVNHGNLYTAPKAGSRPAGLRSKPGLSTIVEVIASAAARDRTHP